MSTVNTTEWHKPYEVRCKRCTRAFQIPLTDAQAREIQSPTRTDSTDSAEFDGRPARVVRDGLVRRLFQCAGGAGTGRRGRRAWLT